MENIINNHSRVDGYASLVRDEYTNAILNTNYSSYNTYRKTREVKNHESKRINKLETDMKSIKKDLDEIKSLLKKCVL